MNNLGSFRNFLLLLLGIFGFNWAAFVVLPWIHLGHLPPIQEEGDTDITPFDASGLAHQGEQVYAANGCVYCHTQQVRADSSGADIIRGWGTATDLSDDKKQVTRRSYPRDYIWQHEVFLGNSRNGADLSNVAQRFPDAAPSIVTFTIRTSSIRTAACPPTAFFSLGRRLAANAPWMRSTLPVTMPHPPVTRSFPPPRPNRSSLTCFPSRRVTIFPTKKAPCPPLLPTRVKT